MQLLQPIVAVHSFAEPYHVLHHRDVVIVYYFIASRFGTHPNLPEVKVHPHFQVKISVVLMVVGVGVVMVMVVVFFLNWSR